MKKFQLRTVNKAFSDANIPVELVKGEGYFYFVYDDVDKNIYETKSIMTMFLCDTLLATWISDGKNFADKVVSEYA